MIVFLLAADTMAQRHDGRDSNQTPFIPFNGHFVAFHDGNYHVWHTDGAVGRTAAWCIGGFSGRFGVAVA